MMSVIVVMKALEDSVTGRTFSCDGSTFLDIAVFNLSCETALWQGLPIHVRCEIFNKV